MSEQLRDPSIIRSARLRRSPLGWLDHLTYPQKFILISLMFILPLAVVMYLLVAEQNKGLAFAQKEISGTRYLRPLRYLLEDAQTYQRLTRGAGAVGVMHARLEADFVALGAVEAQAGTSLQTAAFYATLTAAWNNLRVSPPSDTAQTQFIQDIRALTRHVGNTSNLILDPDLDSYYVMAAILLNLPETQDRLAQAVLLGEQAARLGTLARDDRAQLNDLIALVRDNLNTLQAHLQTGYANNPAQTLQGQLDGALHHEVAAATQLLDTLETRLIQAETINISSAELAPLGDAGLAAGYQFYDAASLALEALLRARIDSFTQTRNLTLGFSLSLVVVGIAFGLYIMSTISGPLSNLTETTHRLAAGDMAARVTVTSADEMGQVGAAFNLMATELQRAYQALRDSEQRYRSIFENAQEGIFQSTPDGYFRVVNPALARMLGYDMINELLQLRIADDVYFNPAEGHRMTTQLDLSGHLSGQEVTWKKKNNEPITVSLYSHVIFDEAGAVSGYEGLTLNITERKQAEAALQQEHNLLEQRVAERTAQWEAANRELEAFSYSVSHDLRAPVRAVHGFARILLDEYAPQLDAPGQEYVRLVVDNAHRMGELIDDLLEFARLSRQPLRKQPVDMNAVVRRARENLPPEPAPRVVEWQVEDLPPCDGDASLLRQVYINCFTNALKFTRARPWRACTLGQKCSTRASPFIL